MLCRTDTPQAQRERRGKVSHEVSVCVNCYGPTTYSARIPTCRLRTTADAVYVTVRLRYRPQCEVGRGRVPCGGVKLPICEDVRAYVRACAVTRPLLPGNRKRLTTSVRKPYSRVHHSIPALDAGCAKSAPPSILIGDSKRHDPLQFVHRARKRSRTVGSLRRRPTRTRASFSPTPNTRLRS